MTFAIKLEDNLQSVYSILISNGVSNLEEHLKASKKRKSNLERSRRENVTEITLEPIEGLESNDYIFDIENIKLEDLSNIIKRIIRFYEDAGPKINVLETRRVMKRNLKDIEKYDNLNK